MKSKIKVFISYANEDRNKVDALERALLKTDKYEVVIVAKKREPMKSLADKVMEGIGESLYFIPILTENSRTNQWVNQEIGYAMGIGIKPFPIVEDTLFKDEKLKGFINRNVDLFSFNADSGSKHREGSNFRRCYTILIDYLNTLNGDQNQSPRKENAEYLKERIETKLHSIIIPKKVKQGHPYTTRIAFQGMLKNGFYDNYVKHLESGWHIWNWDRSTLDNTIPKTPGRLHGIINDKREYTYDTRNWPIGKYRIDVRVYDHPDPTKTKRKRVIQESHDFEVMP